MVGHNLNETLIQLIARKAAGGKATLIHKSITENGNYDPADEDPPVDGYDYVSVSVETYEDELAQALADLAAAQAQIADYQACQAAVIGKIQEYDPNFDPQDCSDIVDKIDEDETEKQTAEQEAQECNDCKAQVVSKIQQYVPNFNPQTCQEMVEGIDGVYDAGEEAAEGFEFPTGTEYDPDIVSIVGDAHVTDETLGITLIWRYTHYGDYGANGWEAYYVQNGEEHYITAASNTFSDCIMTFKSIKVIDSTTGKLEILWDYTYHGGSYTWHESTYPTVSALIGFGSSGHTFKAKNG